MTLQKLIDAVQRGDHAGDLVMALPDQRATDLFYAANRGSLDAAKALHDALLPGWRWRIEAQGVWVWRIKDDFTRAGCAKEPARAWLIAILRALEQTAPKT